MKDILLDFILFSGIEGFIFCLFFYKIGNCRKFKWYEWLIMSFGNCVISKVFPPIIYQILMIIWMAYFNKFVINEYNYKYYLKFSGLSMFFFLITEMPYNMILELFNITDIFDIQNKFVIFEIMIPLRIIQFIIIYMLNKIKRGE